ncbi:MAG: TonB-dependent receptor plug domain-containing protein [Pseudohongiellaceae bacterium]
MTISATRLPRSIEDIAGTVTLVTAENLDRQIANDLDDVVRFQPGVSLETATRGGNQGFSIRGIGGNRVLTVIDVWGNDIYAAGPSSYGKDSYAVEIIPARFGAVRAAPWWSSFSPAKPLATWQGNNGKRWSILRPPMPTAIPAGVTPAAG